MRRITQLITLWILALLTWSILPNRVSASTALIPKSQEVTVNRSSITFSDIFFVPRDLKQLKDVTIIRSYTPGQIQPVYQYQVARALQSAELSESVKVQGKFPMVVKIGKYLIPEKEIASAIDAFWRRSAGGTNSSVEWSFIRQPQIFTYPDEEYSLDISYNGHLNSGRIAIHLNVKTSENRATYSIPVKISLKKEIFVAAREIARGQQLLLGDFTKVTRSLNARELRYSFSDYSSLQGSVARMQIHKGTVVLNHMVKQKEIIQPGQDVKVELQRGGIRVSSIARALEPGSVHDEIEVRDRHTGKILHGTITKTGTVHVNPVGL